MNDGNPLDEELIKEVEVNTEKALKKTSKQKKSEPQVIQNGSINIANFGSGNINFTGLTLDELTNRFGKLIPIAQGDKAYKIYTPEKGGEMHFIIDDQQCVGTLYNVESLKEKLQESEIRLSELKKQNEILNDRISDLKDEIKFLRSKI